MKKIIWNFSLLLSSILFPIITIEIAYKFYRLTYKDSIAAINKNLSCNEPYIEKESCYGDLDNYSAMQFTTLNGYKPLPDIEGNGYKNDLYGFRQGKINDQKPDSKAIVFSGGSTAWGAGVKTKDVYSSIFHEYISKYGYHTINAAVGGYTISQELNRIINDANGIQNLTHWIMFSGWNDIYAGYRGQEYYLSPDMFNLLQQFMKLKPKGFMLTTWQKKELKKIPPSYSTFFTIIVLQKFKYMLSNTIKSDGKVNSLSPDDLTNNIVARVEAANAIAKAKGLNFTFALQPSIYNTKKELTPFELNILEKNKTSYPDLPTYFSSVYPLLKRKLQKSSLNKDYIFIDIDPAISSEPLTVFTDHVHFGDRGNKLIANFMIKYANLFGLNKSFDNK